MGVENIQALADTKAEQLKGLNLDERAYLSCKFLDQKITLDPQAQDTFLERFHRLCPGFPLEASAFSNRGMDKNNVENGRLTRAILALQIVLNNPKIKPDGILGKDTWDAMQRMALQTEISTPVRTVEPLVPAVLRSQEAPVFTEAHESQEESWPDPTNPKTAAFGADSHLVALNILGGVPVAAGGDGNSIEEIHKKLLVNRELIPDIAESLKGKVLVLGGLGNDVVEGNELADVLKNYREIVDACKKQGIKVVILKRPPYAPGVRAVHKRKLEAFWKALEEEFKNDQGVKLINLDSNFADEKGNLVSKYIKKVPDGKGGFKTDGFHLNTKGYKLMITALREAVVTPPTTKISGLAPTETSTKGTL